MPAYTYRCPECRAVQDVIKPMAAASDPAYCGCGARLKRVYNAQRIIIRPRGYNLRPGERASSGGLAYDDFGYELERGDLRDDATGAYTPETRAKREAEINATDVAPERTMAEIDRDIPERAHVELHEWARAAYPRLEEARERSA